VIHGDRDTIAPVEEARYFAAELDRVSNASVYYAELPGAQHAFDLFCSPRTAHMLDAVLKFLNATLAGKRRLAEPPEIWQDRPSPRRAGEAPCRKRFET
jgi:hypothetical protein